MSSKAHWENIYANKQPDEVSWTQTIPQPSLSLIQGFNLPKDAAIIDVGGGDSQLVDYLLNLGYTNISVLDISKNALERTQKRLGPMASSVHWIETDITEFTPETIYDLWHDRAVFHFLTRKKDIDGYLNLVKDNVNRALVLSTFSIHGPLKCSGLDVSRYNDQTLSALFEPTFEKKESFLQDHETPFGTKQNFLFYSGIRKRS